MQTYIKFSWAFYALSIIYGFTIFCYPFTALGKAEMMTTTGPWIEIWWLVTPLMYAMVAAKSLQYTSKLSSGEVARMTDRLSISTEIFGVAVMVCFSIYLLSYFGKVFILPIIGIAQIVFAFLLLAYSYWTYTVKRWHKINLS